MNNEEYEEYDPLGIISRKPILSHEPEIQKKLLVEKNPLRKSAASAYCY